jgi:hypothetical protein
VPVFRREILRRESKYWHTSYIFKILTNPAVYGEFEPHTEIDGKRLSTGKRFENYYPAIISKTLFDKAQRSLEQRRTKGRGRKGPNVSNLFSGVATCVYCDSPMKMEDKGRPPKGRKYLVCSAAKAAKDCCRTGWRYEDFERSFVALVKRVDLPDMFENSNPEKKVLEDEFQSAEGELAAKKNEFERTASIMLHVHKKGSETLLGARFNEIQKRYDEAKERCEAAAAALKAWELDNRHYYESRKDIKSVIDPQETDLKGSDLYKARALYSDRIKAVVKELRVAAVGGDPIEDYRYTYQSPKVTTVRRSGRMFLKDRYFEVTFHDDTSLLVVPDRDDPRKLDYFAMTE